MLAAIFIGIALVMRFAHSELGYKKHNMHYHERWLQDYNNYDTIDSDRYEGKGLYNRPIIHHDYDQDMKYDDKRKEMDEEFMKDLEKEKEERMKEEKDKHFFNGNNTETTNAGTNETITEEIIDQPGDYEKEDHFENPDKDNYDDIEDNYDHSDEPDYEDHDDEDSMSHRFDKDEWNHHKHRHNHGYRHHHRMFIPVVPFMIFFGFLIWQMHAAVTLLKCAKYEISKKNTRNAHVSTTTDDEEYEVPEVPEKSQKVYVEFEDVEKKSAKINECQDDEVKEKTSNPNFLNY